MVTVTFEKGLFYSIYYWKEHTKIFYNASQVRRKLLLGENTKTELNFKDMKKVVDNASAFRARPSSFKLNST